MYNYCRKVRLHLRRHDHDNQNAPHRLHHRHILAHKAATSNFLVLLLLLIIVIIINIINTEQR